MKAKNMVTGVLLAFVVISAGYLIVKEMRSGPRSNVPVAPDQSTSDDLSASTAGNAAGRHKVIAYYFHGDARCMTCRKLEAYTHEAIAGDFVNALKDGELDWRVVNIDKPENEHFIQDYQLTTRSVVLVEMVNGKQKRWKNLKRIWDLVRNKTEFQQYICEETGAFLEKSD
ncbi:nitrophenyl compound nitroreductase subunit ArsF family protein [Verrucomicrobiota bacterium]